MLQRVDHSTEQAAHAPVFRDMDGEAIPVDVMFAAAKNELTQTYKDYQTCQKMRLGFAAMVVGATALGVVLEAKWPRMMNLLLFVYAAGWCLALWHLDKGMNACRTPDRKQFDTQRFAQEAALVCINDWVKKQPGRLIYGETRQQLEKHITQRLTDEWAPPSRKGQRNSVENSIAPR